MNAPVLTRPCPCPLRWAAGLLLLLAPFQPTLAQSLVFDGQNDRLLLLGSEHRLPSERFTLEAWVRSPHWKNAWFENTILNTDDLTTKEGFAFAAGGRPGGAAQLSLVLSIHGARQRVVSPPLLAANHWYHVAAVVEKTVVRLYVDGREVAVSEVLPGFRHGDQPLQVGNGPWGGRGMNGQLDEVRVWNRARSADEIFRDRTRALRGDEPGLVVYLPLAREADGKPRNRVSNGIQPDLRHHAADPWGPEFAPTSTDVGVAQVDGPDVFSAQDGPRRIQVTVTNGGDKPVANVPLVYRLDGRVVLRDTLRGPLEAGARVVHKTRVPVVCLPGDSSRLEVLTALPADEWPRNDTARAAYHRLGKSRRVVVFDSVLHNFGRGGVEWFQFRRVVLPTDNRRFSRILMHVSVACPKGGCDAWDRVGQVFLLRDGRRYELGRFVTPYGIPCGPWTLDVTDFRSVLRGHCALQSFIHTFTLDGWRLSVSFEFLEGGANPRPFHKITPLWQTDELIYGDDRYPYQLPPVAFEPSPRARELTFRHTVTGLGQGNTDDAGEFARKTHRLVVRREGRADSTVIPHLLWRTDCGQNPTCPGQKGSAFLSRAGWCPGREVQPFTVGLPPRGQGKFTLRYEFQPYRNRLNTGYNSADHTEPHFWVYSYLIEKSDSLRGFLTYTNVRVTGLQRTDGRLGVRLANTGSTPVGRVLLRWFAGQTLLAEEVVNADLAPDAEKVVFLPKPVPPLSGATPELTVLADVDGDEDGNDDVLTALLP